MCYVTAFTVSTGRRSEASFTFEPTPAVAESRARSRFVDCAVCGKDNSEYLFYKTGVRFVRCKTCGLVYTSPVRDVGPCTFDIEKIGQFASSHERALCASDFARFLEGVAERFEKAEGKRPRKVTLLGRFLPDFAETGIAREVGLRYHAFDDASFRRTTRASEVDHIAELGGEPDVVVLHELLEACSDASAVLAKLTARIPEGSWVVAT
jgi:hypothetical protein